jgi:hypothetical protein
MLFPVLVAAVLAAAGPYALKLGGYSLFEGGGPL